MGAYGSGVGDYGHDSARRTYCYTVHYASQNKKGNLSHHAVRERAILRTLILEEKMLSHRMRAKMENCY